MVGGNLLNPAQRAAVFEALSTLPGLTVANDLAGRAGVGVQAPGEHMLIFNASTFALLGTPEASLLRQSTVQRLGQEP